MSTDTARWGEPRHKTVSWYDPLAVAATGARLPGREYVEAIATGALPPPPIAAPLRHR